jgi:histidine triad (HIT) family protein
VTDCIFCSIIAGQLPSSVVYRDAQTLAFMDINQQVSGHVLVIPLRHCADIFEISSEECAAVMETTRIVSPAVKRALNADGIQLWQANGRAAMQDVFHFHMHIFARNDNDDIRRLGLMNAAKFPPRTELDALAAQIARAIA